jgi:hypothetical protein
MVSQTTLVEVALKRYELNERYHEVKERSVWLGVSGYTAFAVALGTWLPGHASEWMNTKWAIWMIVIVVTAAAFYFIVLQNWYKVRSAIIETQLRNFFMKFDDGTTEEPTIADLFLRYTELDTSMTRKERRSRFVQEGKGGVVALVAVLVLSIPLFVILVGS